MSDKENWGLILSGFAALFGFIRRLFKVKARNAKLAAEQSKEQQPFLVESAIVERYQSVLPVNVLIIEDNPRDIALIRKVLDSHQVPQKFKIVQTPGEAKAFLFENGRSEIRALQLIILDINLPGGSGLEILKMTKDDQLTKRVPIVIFTGSLASKELTLAMELGANSCVEKPVEFEEFNRVVLGIRDYWLSINQMTAVNN